MYTTVVPESLSGRGVAKLLADEAFEFAVKEQVPLKCLRFLRIIIPTGWTILILFVKVGLKLTCWYLSGYLKRHPRDDVRRLLLD